MIYHFVLCYKEGGKPFLMKLWKKIMYGVGDIYGGGAFLLISLLFLNYLTDVEMLSPALAGIIIFIGKIWDAVSDPLMGVISDRTKSPFGRRRIYFLLGVIPVFFSFSLLWYSFGITSELAKFFYFLLVYIFFNTVFTMVMIPYNSILPEMIKDYKERTSFTGIRLLFSITSAIIAGVFPKLIIDNYGGGVKEGYLVMGVSFALLYSLPWLIVFFGTWEQKEAQDNRKEGFSYFQELKTVFRNRCFKIHAGIFISGQTAVDFLTTLFIYYLTVCLNRAHEFSFVLGTLLLTQLLVMPLHIKLSQKFSKTTPLRFGYTLWIIALFVTLFIQPTSPGFLIYLIAVLCGFGTAASVLVPWSILPEIADVDEMITTRRREGIYSGMATFLRKVANSISIGIIGIALQLIGYVSPETPGSLVIQSSTTQLGIRLLFSLVPIFFMLLAIYFSNKYPITEEKYNILRQEIERRKSGGLASDIDEEVLKVCEELTGCSYNTLWKNSASIVTNNIHSQG